MMKLIIRIVLTKYLYQYCDDTVEMIIGAFAKY